MTTLTQAEQAAVNRFLNAKLGGVVRLLYKNPEAFHATRRERWGLFFTKNDIETLIDTRGDEAAAWATATDFFSDSDVSYGALHRVEGMLTHAQKIQYEDALRSYISLVDATGLRTLALGLGYPMATAGILAESACSRALPCSTCAPILARVLGFEPPVAGDGEGE